MPFRADTMSGISSRMIVPRPDTLVMLHAVTGAVDHAEALVHVAQADAVGQRRAHPLVAHAQPVVFDLDDRRGRSAARCG